MADKKSIEDRRQVLLDQLENPLLDSHEIDRLERKLEILEAMDKK